MAAPTHVIPDVEEDLAAAERLGLKLMLKTRTVFLLLMMGLMAVGANYPTNIIGMC